MIEYLLILPEHEGIAIRAAHLPRPGDTLDVMDEVVRRHFRFVVEAVEYEVLVENVDAVRSVRGVTGDLPFVQGKVTAYKVDGVWQPTARLCKHGVSHDVKDPQHESRDGCDGCCKRFGAHPERWPAAK